MMGYGYGMQPCPSCGDTMTPAGVCETCALAAEGLVKLQGYLDKVDAFERYCSEHEHEHAEPTADSQQPTASSQRPSTTTTTKESAPPRTREACQCDLKLASCPSACARRPKTKPPNAAGS